MLAERLNEAEEQRETDNIRRAIRHRKTDDRKFLRQLWGQYPHLRPPPVEYSPDVDESCLDEETMEERKQAALARARATVEANRAEYRQNYPVARGLIETVADWFGMEPSVITGTSRQSYAVSARAVAARLIREVKWENGSTRFSYPQIGKMLGNRDHSTIIAAVQNFDDRARKYGVMIEAYEALRDK